MAWTSFKRVSAALVVSFPVAILGAAGAQAALITEWTYQIDSAFTAFSPAGVTGSNPNANLGNAPTTLQWGTGGNGPSSLVVDATVTDPPTLSTGGGPVAGASITHNNNPIGGETLTSATLSTQLVLTAANDPTITQQLDSVFQIDFTETGNVGNCGFESVSSCDDIFVLLNPEVLVENFVVDDFIYTITLGAQGLGPLSDATCAAAGQPSGCVGFTTQEGQANNLQTLFSISAEQVRIPEPASLALLGFGLLGMGAVVRRRRPTA
ncbi:THxN family PEP-CTERM protein [Pelagibius sp. Alg239-R121]|uniref:THxN family PEP-CTERM protein n=1 Tax=Pelagibius sp. Alg239-R121 TaxID=2993448 RepID=UPI0024A7701F|nr:THxN family PEP-CTERM protein [Pelagibius sp. Alg239-R121]